MNLVLYQMFLLPSGQQPVQERGVHFGMAGQATPSRERNAPVVDGTHCLKQVLQGQLMIFNH